MWGRRDVSIDQQKMIFGFILLIVLAGLSAAVALGEVKEETSHGLTPLLTALSVLSGNFANWAFSDRRQPAMKQPDDKEAAA
jgi:hypothetical protein